MKTRSKWLASVLCVVLIVSLALFAVSCKKGGDSVTGNESTSSQEPAGSATGLYYSDSADGEYTLSLNGNSYVLSSGTDFKTGSFTTADGKELTLSIDGAAVTASIAGDELSMTWQGKHYVFLQKIERKVTFNIEGKAEGVVVINGKTAGKPEDPVSTETKRFIGWYTSESYDEAYNFATPVREDVTVYARFVSVDRNVPEFKATLVSGGEKVAVKETVGGVLYDLPALAAKDGKEFDGWYTSDFADAGKLGGLYNGQVLKENTSLYAVWKGGVSGVIVAEDKISWNAIGTGAQNFAVTITMPDGQKSSSNVSTTEWKYDFAKAAAGEYEIAIENRNGDEKTTVYKKNKALARVSDFNVIEPAGILTYNKVENAEKYYITVKCGNEDHNHTEFDNGASSYYDISGCDMTAGGILVTVRATAKGYMDSVSETFAYDRTLGSVKGVEVNENGELVWYGVAGAMSYTVAINGEEIDVGNVTKYSLNYYGAGDYEIGVYPVTKGYNSPAATTISYRKTTLAAPAGLTVAGDTVTWNEVEGAKGYVVKVNGTVSEVSGNSYQLTTDQLAAASVFSISVCAKGETASANSAYSDVCTLGKYTLDYVEYRNGKVYWNPVCSAKGYRVQINAEEATDYAAGVTSADVSFTQKGLNTITVYFLFDGGVIGGQKQTEANAYAIVYNTSGGTKIENGYAVVGDYVSLPDAEYAGYEFIGWYNVPNGAENNGKKISSGKLTKAADLYLYACFVPKRYTVTFDTANGGTTENESATVSFGMDYVLPAATSSDESKVFGGWYSEPNGAGIRYSDSEGNGVGKWTVVGDVTVYAYWVDIFTYALNGAGDGYIVTSGPGISYVISAKIPATYNEKPITNIGILTDVSKLITVSIPDTAAIDIGQEQGVSTSSFQKASNLQSIEVYATGNEPTPRYKGVDGALYTMTYTEDGKVSKTSLFLVPLGKKGALTVAEGTNEIAGYAMYKAKVEKVVIPASVGEIGTAAMSSCTYLTEVECLPDSEGDGSPVLTLAASVFKSSSKIEKLTLRASLAASQYTETDSKTKETTKTLNFDCTILDSCSNLENIEFVGAAKGTYTVYNGMLCNAQGTEVIYCPRGKSGKVILGGSLTGVQEEAFKSCKKIEELVVPGEIQTIGKSAFASATGLQKVTFSGDASDLPLSIGEKAFYGCSDLTSVTLPENLKTLGKYAFGGNSKLVTVNVLSSGSGSGIVFENAAFGSAPSSSSSASFVSSYYVKYVTLGKDVPEIAISGVFGSKIESVKVDPANQYYYADEGGVLYDKKVENLIYYPLTKAGAYTIPSTVTAIGEGVFRDNKSLTAITIPASVKTIGDNAFYGCSTLASVVFEDGETELTIGDAAFRNCSKITELVLPSRLRSAGTYAFASCSSMTKIEIKEGIETLGDYAFNADGKLTEIVLPASLKQMGEYNADGNLVSMNVFNGCSLIERIVIAEGNENYATVSGVLYLKTAGVITDLFYCPILNGGDGGKIVIPATVTKVWDKAFYNNKNITSVTFEKGEAHEITIGNKVFYQTVNLTEIVLPEGLTTISREMFYYATGLRKIEIPATVTTIEAQAFYMASALETVTFAAGGTEPLTIADAKAATGSTTGAGYAAFYGCKKLTEIVLPERTTYIGSYAFDGSGTESEYTGQTSYASSITRVVIPDNVETIGEYAFKYAARLSEVVIGESSKLTAIPGGMFYGCTSLTSFTIPAGVTTIGYNAFYKAGITSIALPEGLTEIGYYAFGYTKLASIVIPKNVTRLGGKSSQTSSSIYGSSFYGCTELESVTFEEGSALTSIESSAFSGCTKLASIVLPDKLEKIGTAVFSKTTITSITIPASVTTIDTNAFEYCSQLSEVVFAEGSELTKIGNYAFRATAIASFAFPETSATKLTVGTDLFFGCKALKSVHLSSDVTSVDNVFRGCASIETVTVSEENQNFTIEENDNILYNKTKTAIRYIVGESSGVFVIPEGTTEISDRAFVGQAGMTKVVIPSTIRSIGKYAFLNCWSLQEVVFNNCASLTELPDYLFQNCLALTEITVPANVTKIGINTFDNCSSLTKITFADNAKVETIGNSAFRYTDSLIGVELPSGVKTLGTNVFQYSGVKSVTIPATVTSIGNYAFADSEIASVTFAEGSKLTTFGTYLFKGSSISSITIPASVTKLGNYMFRDCTELTSVTFETKKLTEIAQYAFEGCTSLKSITIPDGVKTIQRNAFENCTSLSEVNLPSSLTMIATPNSPTSAKGSTPYYGYAFAGCTSLRSITIPDSVTFLGTHTFYGSGLVSVKLPANLKYLSVREILPSKGYASFVTGVSSSTAITYKNASAQFANCEDLQQVILPAKLEALGSLVFYNCPKLTTVVYDGYAGSGNALPKTTTELLSRAFEGSGITNLSLEGVSKVAPYAFYGTQSIKSVTFAADSKLETIEKYTFANATALETLLLPDSVTSIGVNAFSHCESLTALAMPANVVKVGDYAFEYTGLKYLDVSNVTSFGKSVFRYSENLETVTLNAKLSKIASGMFFGCTGLNKLDIPSTVVVFESDSFVSTALTTLDIPANVVSIGVNAFSGMDSLQSFNVDPSNPAYYTEDDCLYTAQNVLLGVPAGKVFINDTFVVPEGKTIAAYVFNGCSNIKVLDLSKVEMDVLPNYAFTHFHSAEKIVLPEVLTEIGSYAFRNCGSLKEVAIPDSVVKIGNYAFQNCTSLETFTIKYVEERELGSYLFTGSGLRSATIEEGYDLLPTYIFQNCENLQTVSLPSTLTIIGQYAFQNCVSLETIDIPANVTRMGYYNASTFTASSSGYVFDGCTALKTVNFLGDKIEEIGIYTFANTPALKSVALPDSVRILGNYAFKNSGIVSFDLKKDYGGTYMFNGATSLANVTIAEGVTTITESMFRGCTALKSIALPSSVANVDKYAFAEAGIETFTAQADTIKLGTYVFDKCASLSSVVFKKDAEVTFGANDFQYCTALKSFDIPSGTTVIPSNLFLGSGITSLHIPGTVVELNSYMVKDCADLTTVILEEGLQKIYANTFNGAKIKSIVIPSTVTTLIGGSFAGWTSDQTIYVKGRPFAVAQLWNVDWAKDCNAKIVWDYQG